MVKLKELYKKFIVPLISVRPMALWYYKKYLFDLYKYKKVAGKKEIENMKLLPRLGDDKIKSQIDPHYFYQAVWAARKIAADKPELHIDIASQALFVGMLTSLTKIRFIDMRPLGAKIPNLEYVDGSIDNLPFSNNSVSSISCLHVAEHIGLGRYGDALDPEGTKKACAELSRVLAYNGRLYFSLPIGKEITFFNAHRIHSPKIILSYFPDLKLLEFSAIDDRGKYVVNAQIASFEDAKYGCGLFEFTKRLNDASK